MERNAAIVGLLFAQRWRRSAPPTIARFVLASLVVSTTACGGGGPTPNEASKDLAREWLDYTEGPQAEVLRDLQVSEAEYSQALMAMRKCLDSLGFETSEIRQLPDGIRKDFGVRAGEQTDAAIAQAWDRCRAEQLEAVESVFLAQYARPGFAQQTLKRDLVSCLLDNGITAVSIGMTDAEIADSLVKQQASVDAWACRERFLIFSGEGLTRPSDQTHSRVR